MQSSAKKCLITVALNLMQRLDYFDNPQRRESDADMNPEQLIPEAAFIQEAMARYMVDSAELYAARIKMAAQLGLPENIVPQRPVPTVMDPNDPQYRQTILVDITNEVGEVAGRFGWCVVCRKTANLYCKDSRLPVCSPACKVSFLEKEQIFEQHTQESNKAAVLKKNTLVSDCLNMFRNFMKYAFQDQK